MKLNHIDLQVPDVRETAAFFTRWFGFVDASKPGVPDMAILIGEGDVVLILQRIGDGERYPDGFHIGFHVAREEVVVDFQRRAREAGLEVGALERDHRGTRAYCYAPGRILVEVNCLARR